MRVCVFCATSRSVHPRYLALAADVGSELARRGWQLVSGGGSVSMMGAVATAARGGGARTTGVVPRLLLDAEVADLDADELVITETMRERKAEMDTRSDAFLVLPGGLGTLEELLEVWVARSLGMHAKPVIVLDPYGDLAPLQALVSGLVRSGFVRASASTACRYTQTLDEAFAALTAPASWPAPAPQPDEMLEAEL